MFVRKKSKSGGGSDYYQLVENRRVDGRPKQRVVMHLNHYPTVDEALKGWPKDMSRMRRDGYPAAADKLRAKLDRLKGLKAAGVV